jgi:hypothetical protein
MNNLQIKTRASQVIGASSSGADSAEEWALLQDLANEAIIDILGRTRINVRGLTINLLANEQEYDLGKTVLRLFDMKHGSAELSEVSPGDIDEGGSTSFAVLGFNRVMFGFVPSVGDTVKGWYTPMPTPMAGDNDDPSDDAYGDIPVVFHPAIVNYMCWKGADLIGDTGSGRGEKYRLLYEGQDGTAGIGSDLGKIKTAINMRLGSGAGRRRVRRLEDRTIGDADPSYWTG